MANETNKTMELAIGRIFRIMSRSEQPGDVAEYERCRSLILDCADELGISGKGPSVGINKPGWNFGGKCVE